MKQEKIQNLTILLEAFLSLPESERVSVDTLASSLVDSVLEPLKIRLNDWRYQCGDRCCDDYGTELFLNNIEADNPNAGGDVENSLEFVLGQLGYEVEIERTYEE
jgi:hypothetical protein